MDKKNMVSTIVTSVIIFIIRPLLAFAFGFLTGLITQFLIGNLVAKSLNILLQTTYYVPATLPWIGGCLNWLSSFWKTTRIEYE